MERITAYPPHYHILDNDLAVSKDSSSIAEQAGQNSDDKLAPLKNNNKERKETDGSRYKNGYPNSLTRCPHRSPEYAYIDGVN